jgi:DEAD/DEAH box helicase domain-containing protein
MYFQPEKGVTHCPREWLVPLPRKSEAADHSGAAWHWTSDSYPADAVSLRAVSKDNFLVVEITGDHSVIAEVAFTSALTTLHEKVIYLHEVRQYQVERFDYEGRKAYVRCMDSDYFTDAIDYTQVK